MNNYKDLIQEFLKTNEPTIIPSEEPTDHVEYRRSKQTMNQLTAKSRVVPVTCSGNASIKRIEDGGALDMLKKIKPKDEIGAVGKRFKDIDNNEVAVLDFDYFVSPGNRRIERYVCSNGRCYKKSSIEKMTHRLYI